MNNYLLNYFYQVNSNLFIRFITEYLFIILLILFRVQFHILIFLFALIIFDYLSFVNNYLLNYFYLVNSNLFIIFIIQYKFLILLIFFLVRYQLIIFLIPIIIFSFLLFVNNYLLNHFYQFNFTLFI